MVNIEECRKLLQSNNPRENSAALVNLMMQKVFDEEFVEEALKMRERQDIVMFGTPLGLIADAYLYKAGVLSEVENPFSLELANQC